ncbi:MAG: TlpA disulfide reductase family protein [Planctomycetota bacterium]
MWKLVWVLLIVSFLSVCAEEPTSLKVGDIAPEWTLDTWINSEPLKLADLRGKVVLVRWVMSTECPFCRATAPALIEFNATYKEKGLSVIGVYQHKRKTPFTVEDVKGFAAVYGFDFPFAIDSNVQTLRAWWLAGERKQFTSVSFLIDRKGIVRYIHPGGQYVKGDPDYAAIKSKIEDVLAEK